MSSELSPTLQISCSRRVMSVSAKAAADRAAAESTIAKELNEALNDAHVSASGPE